MSTINCHHCEQTQEPLTEAPYPGDMGDRILSSICPQCWDKWLELQVMLINENRLSMINPEARSFLREKMKQFLFEKNTEKPAGYQPIDGSE